MEERGSIITTAYTKGGVGKSNTNIQLAVGLAHKGADVCIIDGDKQGTASAWVQRRRDLIKEGEQLPDIKLQQCVSQNKNKPIDLRASALEAARHHDFVVIDPDGRDGQSLRYALMASDLCFVAMEPAQESLEGIDDFIDIIDQTKLTNPDLILRTIFTRVTHSADMNERKFAVEFLEEYGDIMPMAKMSKTSFLNVYKRSIAEGRGVVEENNSKARAQIQMLTDEALNLLELEEA